MPGTTTTIPAVIDALLAILRALPACAPPCVVYDGITGPDQSELVVMVGGTAKPVGDGTVEFSNMGLPPHFVREENYDVEIVVSAVAGGADEAGASGANDAQKAARDLATTVVSALDTALTADPSLSAQNASLPLVNWCLIRDVTLTQTAPDDPDAAMGRRADFTLAVNVYNRLSG